MGAKKTLRRTFTFLLLAFLATAVGAYILASREPGDYRPIQLSYEQRRQVALDFAAHILEFGNLAQPNAPFTWSVTDRQLNEYLASLDEIAAIGGKSNEVQQALAAAGLTTPAVGLQPGRLTLMVRTMKYNKILSMSLSFEFTEDKKLRVRPGGAKVGRLPLPDFIIRAKREKLRKLLAAPADDAGDSSRPGAVMPTELAATALMQVVSAMNGEPISTELTYPIGKKRVRIDGIEIDANAVTLHVVPVGRGRRGNRD